MMADKPIIFSAPMVRALIEGRKTQTRRLAWRRVARGSHPDGALIHTEWNKAVSGMRLWVREAWAPHCDGIAYRASHHIDGAFKWRPSIHMPRWASRLTLTIAEVRRQRLQEISEEDARAEGATKFNDIPVRTHETYHEPNRWSMESPRDTDQCLSSPYWAFANFWGKLHGIASWNANPEVIALTFVVAVSNGARKTDG